MVDIVEIAQVCQVLLVDLLLGHTTYSRFRHCVLPLLLHGELGIRIVGWSVVQPLEAVVLGWWIASVLVITVVELVVLVVVHVILHHFYG